jgi:ABC-type proline/glycine betaine transport system substrate-binding protein
MKHVLLALAFLFVAAACSKYDVYGENIHYMTAETFAAEKAAAAQGLEAAQARLATAQASGNTEDIKQARADVSDATARLKAVSAEDHARNRHW